ncbi:unnamed protein product (macronuclear) [Paramecium tetraurelia]|uniref:Ribosome biogenesis protein NOP53 n=1 Tax=Paramecium tetraurelia TaxID=5888 RepID=A0EFZ5_PARTE|nr:uncharacterized protein GSPATT00026559001 [Paramecium tetraurelia]CAK94236.1 unnamed protein product [Paramecium tetraurelia]|eukprot:XP_001461609.1 hypothetical protein (macronuclear) [Paramecium tetraurelia strain d4-2]
MGQSCIKKQKIENERELECQLNIIQPICQSNQIKRPIYEICYIQGREETNDEVYDLDLETRKPQKQKVKSVYNSKSNFSLGVKQQKQLIKSQLKSLGADVSQIFNPKKQKLVRSDRESRALEYSTRLVQTTRDPKRCGTFSSNKSMDNSQSPLQFSLKQQNHTYDSIRDEIKSVRSMKPLNQQQSNHGILKQKKGKAKSMYYKRTVRFQF